jgi:hypothetical protein
MKFFRRPIPVGVLLQLLVTSPLLAEEPATAQGAAPVARPSALDLMLGVGAFSRALHFTDSAQEIQVQAPFDVHDDTVDVALAGAVAGHWYPLALFMGGPFAHLGITADFARTLSQTTQSTLAGTDVDYSHIYQRFGGGLRGRIPLPWLTLGVEAKYVSQSLWVRAQSAGADPAAFPDVEYSLLEGRVDGEARINRVILAGYAGFDWALSVGELGEEPYFKNAQAYGISFGGHVGYQVHDLLDVLVGADAQQLRLNFNRVEPTDPRIAGGASDRYVTFWLGLRFVLPGSSGATQAGAEPGAKAQADDDGGFDDFDSFE